MPQIGEITKPVIPTVAIAGRRDLDVDVGEFIRSTNYVGLLSDFGEAYDQIPPAGSE